MLPASIIELRNSVKSCCSTSSIEGRARRSECTVEFELGLRNIHGYINIAFGAGEKDQKWYSKVLGLGKLGYNCMVAWGPQAKVLLHSDRRET